MLTVVCVYWKGEFRGRENVYSEEWVGRLENMVFRNMPVPHRFVCLSNVDVPCERIPLIHDWPGWWSKIELFRPGIFGKNRVLYLDLDLVVLSSLYPFIEFPSTFGIIKSYGKGISSEGGKKILKAYNSSVMVFDAGWADSLYTEFNEKIINKLRGDQDYIALKLPKLNTFPKEWVRKLGSLPNRKPKDTTKIVLCMAGKELLTKNQGAADRYPWVEKIWQ